MSSFFRRSFVSTIFLILALSLIVNLFLIVTRSSHSLAPSSSVGVVASSEQAGSEYPSVAFGSISRPFTPVTKFHQLAVAGKYAYADVSKLLPEIPADILLYRDQGITVNADPFFALLHSVGITDPGTLHLLPKTVGFETSDGQRVVTVDVVKREFLVEEKHLPTAEKSVQAPTDSQLQTIARAYVDELGLNADLYDAPSVFRSSNTTTTAGAKLATVTEVRWPMKVGNYPVVDQYAKPAIGMTVVLDPKTAQPTQVSVRVLSPSLLAASAYPSAGHEFLVKNIMSGGLTPIRQSSGKVTVPVVYSEAKLAYALWETDGVQPTYMFPVVLLSADVPLNCKSCEPWHWTSYVPAIDPAQFQWKTAVSASVSSEKP